MRAFPDTGPPYGAASDALDAKQAQAVKDAPDSPLEC